MMLRVGDLSCLTDDAIGENAESAVSGMVYHLKKVSNLWKDVLPNAVGHNSGRGSGGRGSGGSGGSGGSSRNGGGGSGGGRSGSLQASNANAAPTMYHRAMGALLGVVATELMKRVDALEGNTTTSNKHEMQHLLKILVHEAPKVFEEGAQLVDFVPNWGRLLRAANGEGGEGGEASGL